MTNQELAQKIDYFRRMQERLGDRPVKEKDRQAIESMALESLVEYDVEPTALISADGIKDFNNRLNAHTVAGFTPESFDAIVDKYLSQLRGKQATGKNKERNLFESVLSHSQLNYLAGLGTGSIAVGLVLGTLALGTLGLGYNVGNSRGYTQGYEKGTKESYIEGLREGHKNAATKYEGEIDALQEAINNTQFQVEGDVTEVKYHKEGHLLKLDDIGSQLALPESRVIITFTQYNGISNTISEDGGQANCLAQYIKEGDSLRYTGNKGDLDEESNIRSLTRGETNYTLQVNGKDLLACAI